MSSRDALLRQLLAPGGVVCALDDAAGQFLAALGPAAPEWFRDEAAARRADLAFGLSVLEPLSAADAHACLFRARTFIAPSVLVAAGARCALALADFRALAFEPLLRDADGALYQFNLATYKPAPDWLNARYWAHPERWDQ